MLLLSIRNKNIDFRLAWNTLPKAERMALLDQPRIITLFNQERFLASASPLPLEEKGQGFYVILTSLENTLHFMEITKRSIFWVSGVILCVILLIAYFIFRRCSLAGPVPG